MLTRTLTVLVAVPIVALCTYFGELSLAILVGVMAIVSVNEFYAMMQKKDFEPQFIVGNFFTLFFMVFIYQTLKHPHWEPAATGILTLAMIIIFSGSLFLRKTSQAIVNMAVTLLGILYVGWFFSYLILIRALTPHGAYLFFLLIVVWAGDSAAYFIGTAFGRIKIAPLISPSKTVEGAVAGFIISVAAAGVFGWFIHLNLTHALILGALVGVVAQISDLVESLIKRDAGVKDSSNLIPGHGGVLDRMDSFILTAPVMYYYLSWFVLK